MNKTPKTRDSAELEKVVLAVTQGHWLGNRKVRSLVVGEDRNRLHGKRTIGEEGKEEEDSATEYTDLGERNKRVACHNSALAITDEACRKV